MGRDETLNEETQEESSVATETMETEEETLEESTENDTEDEEVVLDLENERDKARKIVEAIIYIEGNISMRKLSSLVNLDASSLRPLIEEINAKYESIDSGLEFREIGESVHMISNASIFGDLAKVYGKRKKTRLSKALVETLSIIAYKQKEGVTKAEIDDIRGRDSSRHIKELLKLEFIKPGKRKDILHRPQTYETTDKFLMHFDLRSLEDLPPLREIKELDFGRE